jgi:hypothetical protein
MAEAKLDGRVLLFGIAVSLTAALLFSIGPGLTVWRKDIQAELREGGRAFSPDIEEFRFRKILAAVEIALAAVLLVGCGLMVKSFVRMYSYQEGLHPARIITMKIQLSGSEYREVGRQRHLPVS